MGTTVQEASCRTYNFMKGSGDKVTTLVVYVDIVMTRNDEKVIKDLNAYLGNEFEIKDLGELKCYLMIKVVKFKKGTVITKHKYTL